MKTRKPAGVLILVLGGLLLLAAAPVRAGDSTVARSRAEQLVTKQKGTIAFFMHPTATLKSVSLDGNKTYSSGDFCLDYTFYFKSMWGNAFTSKMKFYFFENGTFDYCIHGKTTAWVNPFRASNLVFNWTKKRIRENAELQGNRELLRQIDNGDARRLLESWLKLSQ